MIHLALVAVGLVVIAQAGPPPSLAGDLKTYEGLRAKAGRDPSAHVQLALWCEAHGLDAERQRHLVEAITIDPGQVKARGLLGLVDYNGRWLKPDDIDDRRKADTSLIKKLEEYNARRASLYESLASSRRKAADPRIASRGHEKLGLWCEEQGLKDQAMAHLTTAVQLDPYHEATWKHLGYVRRQGRWMTHEQIAVDDQEASARRKADKHWEPLLRKWKAWLGEKVHRVEAERLLATVVDAAAVPSIVRVFGNGTPAVQLIAVSMLARIDGSAAAKELARLAVFNDSASVRLAATAALKGRPLRDYVGGLIEMVHSPVVYKIQPVAGVGSTGVLAIDTPRFHLVRTYDAPPAFTLADTFHGYVGLDGNGMPLVVSGFALSLVSKEKPLQQWADIKRLEIETQEILAAANLKAVAAQQQLVADVNSINTFNSESALVNQRVLPLLQSVADAPDLKDDQDALKVWWYDKLGYQYEPPPKVTLVEDAIPQLPPPLIYTCFAAGTLVRTPDGSRPIEQIQVGDPVLSQDVTTGALEYQPVLVVHHNKPGKTLRIRLSNDETLVSSVYHRFWRSGRGWALARELEPGDKLRTLGGQVRVASIEPGDVVPVYNLDVARKRSFFVGHGVVLVHDNSLPEVRVRPFDLLPVLTPEAAPAR